MALTVFCDSAALAKRGNSEGLSRVLRLATGVSVAAVGTLLAATPAAAVDCQFAPLAQINSDVGVEPQLLIDGICTDPDYNMKSFVVDKTEQLSLQVPGGPLIPYTQVSGHFPATRSVDKLPAYLRQTPTVFRQDYVFRFPAKEFWRHRSFEQQHPSGGGQVDNRMAFTNGAFSVNWMSASTANAVASHRHEAAATQVAKAYASKLYGYKGKIYSYFWGCSGGGIVSMAAAENTTGIWDGVQPQCLGPTGIATFHSFHWQAHYTMAIPQAKRDAIAAAAVAGGTGDIYAGLNDEEKSVLNEFISAGYPLPAIGNHFKNLIPLVDPIDVRLADPAYEEDFWSQPGYAGSNPPNYLKAALVDAYASVTGIIRDANGVPTAVQFNPAAIPTLGVMGDNYLEFFVYSPDGKTRTVDPVRVVGEPSDNRRRFGLMGKFDTTTGLLTLGGTTKDVFGGVSQIRNSKALLDALQVGSKVRINNRFILAMYYYPRYSIIPGMRSYDQYRNADGSAKYPQRKDLSVLLGPNYRTMGGRNETGAIKTKVMVIEGRADNLSWPIFNASYAEQIQRTIGKSKARSMMRFYLHDNGRHAVGGGEPGIFQQSMQDMMAWVEKGVTPPPSTSYTIRNGQVVPPDNAAERGGLQPVMSLTANGVSRVTVGIKQPVNLAAKLEMPPKTGQVVQYSWSVNGTADPMTVLDKPLPLINASRSISFDKPGTYVLRLTVSGQRDGQVTPANQTLLNNFQEVRVIVQ